MVCPQLRSMLNQWHDIGCLTAALVEVDTEDIWEKSFKTVNLHPHHRVSFKEWIARISDHV
eukprot:8696037-Ditylum_brightwellii.AAC.1